MEVSTRPSSLRATVSGEGWRHVRLTDVARLESGHTPSKRNPDYWNGNIPWISLHDTEELDAWEIETTSKTISEAGLANSSARLLPKGTVVFSRTATVGKATVMGRSMATSQDFACYVCGSEVHNFYLALLFRSMRAEWKRLMAGSIHNTVYMPVFKALSVSLPPFDEQVAIAEAMLDVERQIDSLQQLLTKKHEIKQGAMQELLTGKRRLPGHTGEWITGTWSDIMNSCSSGATPLRSRPEYYNGPVRWITSGELNYGVIDETLEHLSEEAVEKTNLRIHPAGTFLIAITGLEAAGTRGACGIVGRPAATNQSCMAIYTSDKLLTNFLFHYYVYKGDDLALQYCQGTKQQSYTAGLIRILPISYPASTHEQMQIVQVLSDMDDDIAAHKSRLAKARDLKQAMMQALLTGRSRLVEPGAA